MNPPLIKLYSPATLSPDHSLYEHDDEDPSFWYINPERGTFPAALPQPEDHTFFPRAELRRLDTRRPLRLGVETAWLPVLRPDGTKQELLLTIDEIQNVVDITRHPWKYDVEPLSALQAVLEVISKLADLDEEGSEKYVFQGFAETEIITRIDADSPEEAYRKMRRGECDWYAVSFELEPEVHCYFGKGEVLDYGFNEDGVVSPIAEVRNRKGLTEDEWQAAAGLNIESITFDLLEVTRKAWRADEDPAMWAAQHRAALDA
jgi:hypothetical protein